MSTFERELVDHWTTETLVERNSPALLASHVRTLAQRVLDLIEEHATRQREIRATLTEAEKIGLTVMEANRSGRKTLRVADLIPTAPEEPS